MDKKMVCIIDIYLKTNIICNNDCMSKSTLTLYPLGIVLSTLLTHSFWQNMVGHPILYMSLSWLSLPHLVVKIVILALPNNQERKRLMVPVFIPLTAEFFPPDSYISTQGSRHSLSTVQV